MEYVAPPRAASALLHFFAGERDLAYVVGDLSEEFQRRAAAEGHAAAQVWYWRETFRNAMALGRREFALTPVKVLAASLLTGVSAPMVIALLAGPAVAGMQRAWIPDRVWQWYEAIWQTLVPWALYMGSGVAASFVVKARELALAAWFGAMSTVYTGWLLYIFSYSSARGRLPAGESLSQLNERALLEWAGTILCYSAGCLWIRWRRVARPS